MNGSKETPLLKATDMEGQPIEDDTRPLTFDALPARLTINTGTANDDEEEARALLHSQTHGSRYYVGPSSRPATSTAEIQSVYGPMKRKRAGPGADEAETAEAEDDELEERICPKVRCCTKDECTESLHVAWIRFKYFLSHAWIEARKRKVQYCLGFFSIFFVVLIAALCFTLVAKAPAVFLQQAENTVGQIDILLAPVQDSPAPYLNYTLMQTEPRTASLYGSPRWTVQDAIFYPVECTTYLESFGIITPLSAQDPLPTPTAPQSAVRPSVHELGWAYTGPTVPTDTVGVYDPVPGMSDPTTKIAPAAFPSGCRVTGTNCLADMCRPVTDSSTSTPPPPSPTGAEVLLPSRVGPLVAWDSNRDRAIAAGRDADEASAANDPGLRPLAPRHIILTSESATRLGANAGDTIIVSVPTSGLMKFLLRDSVLWAADLKAGDAGTDGPSGLPELTESQREALLSKPVLSILEHAVETLVPYVHIPMYVEVIQTGSKGRLSSEDETEHARVELSTVLSALASNLPPALFVKNTLVLASLTNYNPEAYDTTLPSAGDATLPWSLADVFAKAISTPRSVGVMPNGSPTNWEAPGDSYWADLRDYATTIIVNGPHPRTDMYVESNYDALQDAVAKLGVDTAFAVGFSEVSVTLPILDELRPLRFFALFLGLILSVILTILFILSFMLIYSLLMISIETRTFELGVHRMTGLTRMGIVWMMIIQACSYSLPAWALGLILSRVGSAIVTQKLADAVGVPLSGELTGESIGVATALGLLIPLFAVILPIREALGKNLQDALDTRHSKTLGVQFHIERSEDNKISLTSLVLGIGLTVFGFLIYYLLPLSLISMNLGLFFNIFFGILLGLLFGLIILSLNFEHIIERFLVGVFFFWELSSIPKIVLKNLVAHRIRNRKTTVMYALSLAFIIFITVAYLTEIQTARANRLKRDGAPIVITGRFRRGASAASVDGENAESGGSTAPGGSSSGSAGGEMAGVDTVRWRNEGMSYQIATECEKILDGNPAVLNWAWQTSELNSGFFDAIRTSNIGHYFEHSINVFGVSPSYFDVTYSEYYIARKEDRSTAMSLSEQLYTIRGQQSAAIDSGLADWTGLKDIDGKESRFLLNQQIMRTGALSNGLRTEATSGSSLRVHMLKSIAHMDSAAGIPFTAFRRNNPYQLVVSIPTYIALSDGHFNTMEDLSFSKLVITPNPRATRAELRSFKQRIRALVAEHQLRWIDEDDLRTTLSKTEDVMGIIFGVAMYLAMFLWMFSLIASMYSNIFEASKEIGVLRAIGLTINQITRIYLYEAFILVVAASFLGMIIGFIIGFTMTLQRVLFTQLPLTFNFPWLYVIYVLTAAVICAFAAAWAPVRLLVRNSISSIFRTVM